MKKQILSYETPEVEIVEVYVEKGFANSPVVENPDIDIPDDTEQGGFN